MKTKTATPRIEFTPDPTMGDTPLTLNKNEVFVFGANQLGAHGGGSARAAAQYYGAVEGEIHRTGRSYGIVTLLFPTGTGTGSTITVPTPITQAELEEEFRVFFKQTRLEKEKAFYLTKVGLGIAGWEFGDVFAAFKKHYKPNLHKNVVLPKEFADALNS